MDTLKGWGIFFKNNNVCIQKYWNSLFRCFSKILTFLDLGIDEDFQVAENSHI